MTQLAAFPSRVATPSWSTVVVLGTVGAAISVLSPSLGIGTAILVILLLIALHNIPWALLFLVLIAPWASLANVVIGGRLVPLGLDIFVIIVTSCLFLSAPTPVRPHPNSRTPVAPRILNNLVSAMLALGAANVMNPSGLGPLGGMEGYRAFFLPMLALPLGIFLASRAKDFPDKLLLAVILAAAAVACMGIRQVLAPISIDRAIIQGSQSGLLPFLITGTNRLRAFSPLPGPFHFGLIVMLGTIATVTLLLERFRFSLVCVLLLLLMGLALNATRLNWLGTAVGVLILALVSVRRRNLLVWCLRFSTLGLATLAIIFVVARASTLSTIAKLSSELLDPLSNTSLVFRVLGWYQDIFPAIQRAPFLGYGTGMAKDGLGPFTSHNIFLKILLEGGAVLLGLYLATMIIAGIAILRKFRTNRPARVAIAAMAALHAAGLFAPVLDAYPGNLYFWLLLGMGVAASQQGTEWLPTAVPHAAEHC